MNEITSDMIIIGLVLTNLVNIIIYLRQRKLTHDMEFVTVNVLQGLEKTLLPYINDDIEHTSGANYIHLATSEDDIDN